MARKRVTKKKVDGTPVTPDGKDVDDRDALIVRLSERVAALENELLATRDDLQIRQEEMEVQAEELETHLEQLNATNDQLEKEILVRQQSEEALRKNQFILAKSQEMAHVGNWAWNVPTGEMSWSDESFRIFGSMPREFQPDWDWLVSRTYPDDRAQLSDMGAAVFNDGKKRNADVRVILPDGSLRYVNILADKVVREKSGYVSRVYGIYQDVTGRKLLEDALKEREKQLMSRLNAILSPGEVSEKTIYEILDISSLQELADSFYAVTGVGISIIDLEGNVLIGAGWQDICTNFHRRHPETCKNCVESDLHLSGSVEEGKFVIYKCKNGMWDAVTPIIADGKHIANLFAGQFFFDDEAPDYAFFRRQAEKYDFDKAKYLAALDKAPRHSREKVWKVLDFYTRFAGMVSRLSYSNVQLAQSLIMQKKSEQALQEKMEEIEVQAEELESQNEEIRKNYVELQEVTSSLHKSEALLRAVTDTSPDVIFVKDRECRIVMANPATLRVIGKPLEQVIGKCDGEYYDDPAIGRAIMANDRRIMASGQTEVVEEEVQTPDGYRTFLSTKTPFRNTRGEITGILGISRDITERKRVEERLRKQAALIDLSPDGIIVRKQDGAVTFWSKGAEALYGWTKKEALGQQTHMLFRTRFPVPLDEINRQLQQIGHWSGELIHITRDGRQITVQSWWLAMLDNKGNVVEILESNVDVTARKQAEKALQEKMEEIEVQAEELESQNEELRANYEELNRVNRLQEESDFRLRLALEAGEMGWHDYRPLTGRIFVDANFRKIWGLKPEDPFDINVFWSTLHPDDVPMTEMAVNAALDPAGKGRYDVEYRLRPLNDSPERWVHATGQPIFKGEGVSRRAVRFIGTVQDITGRKRNEEALRKAEEFNRRVIGSSADCIKVLDLDGNLLSISESGQRLLEISDVTRYLSKSWIEFWLEPDRATVHSAVAVARAGGTGTFQAYCPSEKGMPKWWDVMITPILGQDGKAELLLAVSRDITARKRADEEVKEAKTQAELYLDLMGHDISNMHQIALSQLELAQEIMKDEGRLAGEEIEMISTPIETLQRSARLIDNVRKLQKLRTGEFRMEIVDLDRVLAEVVAESSGPDRRVTINYTRAPGCLVKANPLIKEAFANLVGNAIKHSHVTPAIDIGVSRVSEGGPAFYRITIEDNGPGIPDEKKGEIFHRFKRGETKAKGTGLGLYIVRTLVENFKGRVRVEDRVPGDYTKGSKFIVDMPVVEDCHE